VTRDIRPHPGRQEQFLASPADIAIYGGAAGGGKTWALLLECLRHIDNPGFGAVLFRRTYPEITNEGGMWDESETLYPLVGGQPVRGDLIWRFPSGARVSFAHLQHEPDKFRYQGAQIALLGFDQLEHFPESAFFYLLSRNRSVCGVRPYVRATCNPDADSWLAEFLAWWIIQDDKDPYYGYADLSRAGVLRWFLRVAGRLVWADTATGLQEKFPDHEPQPKSVTFVPASVFDNPTLLTADPGYLANLQALPPVERERLLGDAKRGGNWKIKPAAGNIFNRAWFAMVDAAPAGGVECLFWDLASTAAEQVGTARRGPSFTAGVSMRRHGGEYTVTECIDFQEGPAEVERRFVSETRRRAQLAQADGARFLVRWELEPGSASRREARRLTQLLTGLDARAVPPQGDKLSRARALAAQSFAGNVHLLRGPWNDRWLNHLHNQPDIGEDDIMDASSGSYNTLLYEMPRQARSYQG